MEPDPDSPATKADVARLLDQELKQLRQDIQLDLAQHATKEDLASMRREMTLELAGEIGRSTDVIIEHLTDRFRIADDRTLAVAERHRAPRRARRS